MRGKPTTRRRKRDKACAWVALALLGPGRRLGYLGCLGPREPLGPFCAHHAGVFEALRARGGSTRGPR